MNKFEEKAKIIAAAENVYEELGRNLKYASESAEETQERFEAYLDKTFVSGESEKEINEDYTVRSYREQRKIYENEMQMYNYLIDCLEKKYL